MGPKTRMKHARVRPNIDCEESMDDVTVGCDTQVAR
jgi:hypothetical protein